MTSKKDLVNTTEVVTDLDKDLEFLEIAHNDHEQEKQTKEWLTKQKHWQIVEESIINSLKIVLESLKSEDPKKYLENKIKELENECLRY